jgi:DNA adenine methylase
MPLNQTSSFTSYTANGFGLREQERLARLFTDLDEQGCFVMLSNSSAGAIAKFYKRFDVVTIPARRAINSKPHLRGRIDEFLVIGHTLRRLHEKSLNVRSK